MLCLHKIQMRIKLYVISYLNNSLYPVCGDCSREFELTVCVIQKSGWVFIASETEGAVTSLYSILLSITISLMSLLSLVLYIHYDEPDVVHSLGDNSI